jgi:hypothetical protein
LDPELPFTAARARRDGFRRLLSDHADLRYVFFVDGDCEVVRSWPDAAVEFLDENPDVAAVAGRRRERHPEDSRFNRMCDFEWNTPVGEAASVGGDAVYRVATYRAAGEFNPRVPAGEEPELCLRLRRAGGKIWRLDREMTVHDAAMTSWRQWWTRQVRTGYGGFLVERQFQLGSFDRLLRGALAWSMVLAAFVLAILAFAAWPAARTASAATALACGGLLLLQTWRIARHARRRGEPAARSVEIATLMMLAKPAIVLGMVRGMATARRGQQATIIEYKFGEARRDRRQAKSRN